MMSRRAFTLIEMMVVVGIIVLLMAILLPSLASARESGKRTVCLANMHSIGQGAASYLLVNNFPAFFDDGITLRGADYSYSWSDFLVKSHCIASEVNLAMMPDSSGEGGRPGVYLAGMVSQRDRIFQCPTQNGRVWGEIDGVPVSYRADYIITGHEQSLPVAGIYKTSRYHQDARLIWMGEAFTNLGGISAQEYVRETQLRLDSNEVNPLRHAGGSTYLLADGHAVWNRTYHTVDWMNLTFPWEAGE